MPIAAQKRSTYVGDYLEHVGSQHERLVTPASAAEATGPGDPPENLQELLRDAIPPVKAVLRTFLDLKFLDKPVYSDLGIALVRAFAAPRTSDLRRLGRDELPDLVYESTKVLELTATVICNCLIRDDARIVASTALLQPAPARAALLRLLAAMMRWEPGVQLPATSGGNPRDSDVPGSVAEEWGRPGDAAGAAGAAGQTQRPEAAGCDERLALRLCELQHGVCWLVSELCAHKGSRLAEMGSSDVRRLLLSLGFGCSLLQTHVLQCLSRHLDAASRELRVLLSPSHGSHPPSHGSQPTTAAGDTGPLVQLPPAAAAASEPMSGFQRQQQQEEEEEEKEGREQHGKEDALRPPAGLLPAAQGGTPGRAAAASSGGATRLLLAARPALSNATVLMPCLYSLTSLATDAYCSASPAAAGSGSSSGPGPSHGSQPYVRRGTSSCGSCPGGSSCSWLVGCGTATCLTTGHGLCSWARCTGQRSDWERWSAGKVRSGQGAGLRRRQQVWRTRMGR